MDFIGIKKIRNIDMIWISYSGKRDAMHLNSDEYEMKNIVFIEYYDIDINISY